MNIKQISTLTAGFSCGDLKFLQAQSGANSIRKFIERNDPGKLFLFFFSFFSSSLELTIYSSKDLSIKINEICSVGIQINWSELEEAINTMKGKTNSQIKVKNFFSYLFFF